MAQRNMTRRKTRRKTGSRPRDEARPPDQKQRDLIVTELDRSLLVEAAAGTGKTTSLTDRMIALLREGRCETRTLAAVTFTRKAAAELRARFAVALERAEKCEQDPVKRERLTAALSQVDQCFIGTIHAFCGRLLRERPVEAGVDLAFEELDEDDDLGLRKEAFAELTRRLLADDPADLLGALDALGLRLADLEDAFLTFASYPDVDTWPVPERALPDLKPTVAALRRYAKRMRALAPKLPRAPYDDVSTAYGHVLRMLHGAGDLEDPLQLMPVLERFRSEVKVNRDAWEASTLPVGKGYDERDAWKAFREGHAEPALDAWAEHRYPTVMRALHAARAVYDGMRKDRGLLSFGDLLLGARDLLQGRPHVRRYFARRFSHLLVDEFQDTDPIQAEVLLLLCAKDPDEPDWTRCRPRPGALFVVGDPKQSIYRFRRADIVTYGAVKAILEQEGPAVQLSANFRSAAPVIDWVNELFAPRFPDEATAESPAYVPLLLGRAEDDAPPPVDLEGVRAVRLEPEWSAPKPMVVERDAGWVARFIRHALDRGLTVRRSARELKEGRPARVTPGDFLIIAYKKEHLARYARRLRELGIPHQVTGSSALKEVHELSLLLACVRAALQPDNPVALVGALRSEAFGVSDAALYAFKKRGGRFYPGAPVPEGLDAEDAAALGDSLACLKRCADWLDRLPPLAAIDRIVAELGLILLAAAGPDHDVGAGSLAKAVELLRAAERQTWTAAQLVELLERLVAGEQVADGISALGQQPDAVRLMNLHKAKGLEAPVVFLADPNGKPRQTVRVHVDRSGDRVTGYLRAEVKRGQYNYVPLAQPAGWTARAAKEKVFLEAEALRLRYVAATRAGSMLVISQRANYNHFNPWDLFEPALDGHPTLVDPGPQKRPALPGVELDPDEVHAAGREIAARRAVCTAATFGLASAKPFALGQAGEAPAAQAFSLQTAGADVDGAAQSEHGTEWGEVIHLLLQVAMQHPPQDLVADLEPIARSALADRELDEGLADQAVQLVAAVTASPLWQRARGSERVLVEAPFSVLRESLDDQGRTLPTVVRGAIDLAFREADGWVVVDYKTDRVPGATGGTPDVSGLVTRYAPQVRLYAEAFTACTGQPVKELGMYFTSTQSYARLDP